MRTPEQASARSDRVRILRGRGWGQRAPEGTEPKPVNLSITVGGSWSCPWYFSTCPSFNGRCIAEQPDSGYRNRKMRIWLISLHIPGGAHMPVPQIDDVDFPEKLHKKMGFEDPATIEGQNIARGDKVNVVGTFGDQPTEWEGLIGVQNDDGSWPVDLEVTSEQRGGPPIVGTEDVSVTVTNGEGTSDEFGVSAVPIIT